MMKDDTISRAAALDALRYAELGCELEAIAELPSAQRWIPTSERLPDKSGLYLVTEKTAYGVNLCSRYWNLRQDRSFWSGWGGDKVLAWCPLPEPYKEGEK